MREDTEEGAKLAKRIGGHLKTLQAISCISYILLYDWSSRLREQINRTFQFRNCHGKFFCSFWCIHGNNPRAVSVWGKRLHTKTSLPVGKRYLPMGKRASVTTTNVKPRACEPALLTAYLWRSMSLFSFGDLAQSNHLGGGYVCHFLHLSAQFSGLACANIHSIVRG